MVRRIRAPFVASGTIYSKRDGLIDLGVIGEKERKRHNTRRGARAVALERERRGRGR